MDGSIHIVYKDRAVLFTAVEELRPRPMVTHQKQQNSQPNRNMSLLRTIPGEDTVSNLNALARRYRCEITRGSF